jgi:hypothetical protein
VLLTKQKLTCLKARIARVHSARLLQQTDQPLPWPISWHAESSNAEEKDNEGFGLSRFLHPKGEPLRQKAQLRSRAGFFRYLELAAKTQQQKQNTQGLP